MSLFNYQARTPAGEAKSGTIEAPNLELAVTALQRRSLIILSLSPAQDEEPWYQADISFFSGGGRVKLKDIVIYREDFPFPISLPSSGRLLNFLR